MESIIEFGCILIHSSISVTESDGVDEWGEHLDRMHVGHPLTQSVSRCVHTLPLPTFVPSTTYDPHTSTGSLITPLLLSAPMTSLTPTPPALLPG